MGKQQKKGIPSFLYDRRFLIFALFAFSIIIRLIYKNAGLWHWDSLKDVIMVERMLSEGGMQYSYAYGAPGMIITVFIFYFLHNLFTGITTAEPAYFFVTLLTAALSVVLLYLITEKLTKNRFISFSAAIFLSITPIFLSATTYPKTHAISVFYALLGGYLLLLSADRNSQKMLALSGLFFGLNIAVRPTGVLYLIPFCLLYIAPRIRKKKLVLNRDKLTLHNALSFIIPMAGIWLLLFLPRIIERGFFGYFRKLNPAVETRGGWLGILSENTIPSFMDLTASLTIIGLVAVILGVFYFYRKKQNLELGALVLWFLMFFIFFGNLAVIHARFLIPALIPLMVLMGAGCYVVYSNNRIAGYVVVLFLVASMIYTVHPVLSYRNEHSETKDFALFVRANTPTNAVVMANDIGFFIEYYGNRETVTHPRSGNPEEVRDFIIELYRYAAEGRPIYSTAEGFAIDPGGLVQQAIKRMFNITLVGEHTNEVYQDATLELTLYKGKLFRLEPSPPENLTSAEQ